MATGRSIQLTKQIGEHLVAAELGRRGYIAAPFAGNVPLFDLLAADANGRSIPIQVKTIKGDSWQYKADLYLDIQIEEGYQNVLGKKRLPNPNLICVFLRLADVNKPGDKDQYFIFTLQDLQEYTFNTYKSRKRPKTPDSLHHALRPKDIEHFLGNWDLIERSLG